MVEAVKSRENWAAQLRAERARLDLTQTQVAEQAGVIQVAVSRAEDGQGSDDVFHRIAAVLDVELERTQP